MPIQRVSEIEGEPIVGKFYLVPCVLNGNGEWIPIVGPEHDDKDYIGGAGSMPHYHRDIRFLSSTVVKQIWERYSDGYVRCSPEQLAIISIAWSSRLMSPALVERRMQCKRVMPEFPQVIRFLPAPWAETLETVYKDATLSSCLKCPHRGMPLKNLPKDEQGNVVCNGHGLKFNLETGKMVSRL